MGAHVTSNGCNRWTCIRVDLQGFLLASSFAFIAIFSNDVDVTKIAVIAVGFQMAMDVTRLFDLCLRWSVTVE